MSLYDDAVDVAYGLATSGRAKTDDTMAYWLFNGADFSPTVDARRIAPAVRLAAQLYAMSEGVRAFRVNPDVIERQEDHNEFEAMAATAVWLTFKEDIEDLHGAIAVLESQARGIAARVLRYPGPIRADLESQRA